MDSILMAAFSVRSRRKKHRPAVVPAVLAVLALLSAGICPGAAAATRAGNVTIYSLNGYYNPYGITTGPDGNIWFTEYNTPSAIGKITPSGMITSYPISNPPGFGPVEITSGPGGDLWFTVTGSGGYVGRITTAGTVTPVVSADSAGGIAVGRGQNVWYTTASGSSGSIGGSHHQGPTPPSPGRASTSRTRSRQVPTGISGSRTTETTRSGASRPPAWSRTSAAPASAARRHHSRPRRSPVVHQHRQQHNRARHHQGKSLQLHRGGNQPANGNYCWPRWSSLVHQLGERLDRTDHQIWTDREQLHRHRHQRPRGHHSRPRQSAMVHQPQQRLDRENHHQVHPKIDSFTPQSGDLGTKVIIKGQGPSRATKVAFDEPASFPIRRQNHHLGASRRFRKPPATVTTRAGTATSASLSPDRRRIKDEERR